MSTGVSLPLPTPAEAHARGPQSAARVSVTPPEALSGLLCLQALMLSLSHVVWTQIYLKHSPFIKSHPNLGQKQNKMLTEHP